MIQLLQQCVDPQSEEIQRLHSQLKQMEVIQLFCVCALVYCCTHQKPNRESMAVHGYYVTQNHIHVHEGSVIINPVQK